MMRETTWMDAQQALAEGFIDGIVEEVPSNNLFNSIAPRTVDRAEAEVKVQAWLERARPHRSKPANMVAPQPDQPAPESEAEPVQVPESPHEETPTTELPEQTGTPVAQLQKRLGLIMPKRR